MIAETKIRVIAQLTAEEIPTGRHQMILESDGKRLQIACDCCGAMRGFRFVPILPMGDPLDYCLDCLFQLPDVLSIKIG